MSDGMSQECECREKARERLKGLTREQLLAGSRTSRALVLNLEGRLKELRTALDAAREQDAMYLSLLMEDQ